MPINKNGQAYYTREQYRAAKAVSALAYAQKQGYELRRDGQNYRLREHDSMVFTGNGYWHWNARDIHGRAIEFAMYYERRNIVDAVLAVAGCSAGAAPEPQQEAKTIEFVPPRRAAHPKRLYAYLCQTRGLSRQTVTDLIRGGLLYEGIIERKGKEYHNAIFPYYDGNGKMVGAYQRGLQSDVPYKCDVPGSRKNCGWLLRGQGNGTVVYIFEAMIDAASQFDLSRLAGQHDEAADRLALGGLAAEPLLHYIDTHPDLERVTLMLDNDAAGNAGAARLAAAAREKNPALRIDRKLPPNGKDWNDALLMFGKGGRTT
mgnify:CR=1 FL=1